MSVTVEEAREIVKANILDKKRERRYRLELEIKHIEERLAAKSILLNELDVKIARAEQAT